MVLPIGVDLDLGDVALELAEVDLLLEPRWEDIVSVVLLYEKKISKEFDLHLVNLGRRTTCHLR